MDVKDIGAYLCFLRKERGLTQEQLGEILGTSNKTISRWETGTYLPPVEMLQQLSDLYGITINEILSGERLAESDFRDKAEENIKAVLRVSAFTLKDKTDYYKKKWKKDHCLSNLVVLFLIVALMAFGMVMDNGVQLIAFVLGIWFVITRNNQMMIYVESRAFDGSGNQ